MKKTLSNTPDLIVSVESRKGGVGKTTAALCLARLLQKRNYAVLVLDLDVTGTNAADIADSPFWRDDLHVICEKAAWETDDSKRTTPINLLTLFVQSFMAGKAIPDFSTHKTDGDHMFVDLSRVNVLGSQIYKTDRGKGITCIDRPGILFDDLHTLWLLELVKQISDDFARVGRDRTKVQ